MKTNWIAFVSSLFLLLFTVSHSMPKRRNKLLYIMLDGFRYDYVDDQPPEAIPGFTKLLKTGVRAEFMSPIFPSVSYPDWTTLVTGLYPESHGIVGNYFYDAQTKENFSLFDKTSTKKPKWWTAEPIWITATKQNRRTAVFLWSLCDVRFDGVMPEFCEAFVKIRGSQIFKDNMEKALDKLENGFDFIQVYNEHIDNVGHQFGPETEERKQAVRELDKTIFYMLERIEEMGMTDEVNIIVVSDHGMTTVTPDKVQHVELDNFLLVDQVENVADSGAFSNIKVKEGYVDQVYEKLKLMPGVNVYRHEEIPDELHFKNNKYIHDIILKANITSYIMASQSPVMLPPRNNENISKGAHGYDPREEKMRAIFFATGPDFKKGKTFPPIKNVDVYPLLAHLLQISPRPNNGTLTKTEMALTTSAASFITPPFFFTFVIGLISTLAGKVSFS